MRREEFLDHGEISPPLQHPQRTERPPELDILNGISDTQTADFEQFTSAFAGDHYGIETLQLITRHVSVFYNIYLRTALSSEEYHYTVPGSTFDENRSEEGVSHFPPRTIIGPEEDVRGIFTHFGRWTTDANQHIPSHTDLGAGKQHDVGFLDYYRHFRNFVNESRVDLEELRQMGYGELQAWMFWRYFTNRTLDCSKWSTDFPTIHQSLAKRQEEDDYDHGKRIWELYGSSYNARINEQNLSSPRTNLPCAYPLGCVQNLVNIVNANQLSWEHEHSRPRHWGGLSQTDSQVMCTHHNRMKGNNFLFDTDTFSKIITIHKLYLLLG